MPMENDSGALLSRRAEVEAAVARVRAAVPSYDALLRESAYPRSQDPRDLPLMDQAWLEMNYYEQSTLLPDGAQAFYTSGTSSGKRKRVLYSVADDEAYLRRRLTIIRPHVSEAFRTACADLGTGHAAASAMEIFRRLGLDGHEIDISAPIEHHVAELNRVKPDVLFTMPMILDRILLAGGALAAPRLVFVVGDVATAAWKRGVRDRLGLAPTGLVDLVGSIEIGSIAYECHRCSRYHIDQSLIPETIRPRQLDLGADEGVLVVTSTVRELFPAIRFVTHDVVRDFGTNVCNGASRYSFSQMVGRTGTELKHGEKISLYDIGHAVHEVLPTAVFEATDKDGLEIRIFGQEVSNATAAGIVENLRRRLPWLPAFLDSGLVAPVRVVQGTAADAPTGFKRALNPRRSLQR